ncbi:MAG TPA: hypothetical protein PLF29_02330, partial [bacterium]|nr:hypothetical protein [bacterium]
STEDAKTAARVFEETVQNKEISEELFTQSTSTGSQTILDFIRKELGNKFSSGEIKRTISQGGLELNGNKVTEPNSVHKFIKGDIIKFGKRTFIRLE